jgi:nicotinamide-nucleotide amidase
VVVGSEILLDGRADTNGPWIESVLARAGIPCILRLVVGDGRDDIADAIRTAARRAPIVIVSGGLGPTFDDLTREAASDALGRALSRDASLEARMRERYHGRGLDPPGSVYRMADVITGAEPLRNRVGSAPGQLLAGPPLVALLPGVPAELEAMLEEELLPRILALHPVEPAGRLVFKISGMYESEVESAISPGMAEWNGIASTILASPGEVTLFLRARGASHDEMLRAAAGVRKALGEAIFAETDESIAAAVGRLLDEARLTLATAESCTGGMLGSMITSVPGSSRWYRGGAVAYANGIKRRWLGVPAGMLLRQGAVSGETAARMARGARRRAGTDLALAVTGIAGPDGGTPSKPVGTVFVALASSRGDSVRSLRLPGNREMIRLRSCRAALDLLRRTLLEIPSRGAA